VVQASQEAAERGRTRRWPAMLGVVLPEGHGCIVDGDGLVNVDRLNGGEPLFVQPVGDPDSPLGPLGGPADTNDDVDIP